MLETTATQGWTALECTGMHMRTTSCALRRRVERKELREPSANQAHGDMRWARHNCSHRRQRRDGHAAVSATPCGQAGNPLLMLPVLTGTSRSALELSSNSHLYHQVGWPRPEQNMKDKQEPETVFIQLSWVLCPALSRSLPTRALGQKIGTSRCSWPEEGTAQSNSGAKGLMLPTESWTKATCPARQDTASLTWDTPRFLLNGRKGSSLLQLVRRQPMMMGMWAIFILPSGQEKEWRWPRCLC